MERHHLVRTNQSSHQSRPPVTRALSTRPQEHSLRHLQRTIGNRAVGRLIQAQLRVSQPGDIYEQEADRVAEQVMRMPESALTISSHASPVSVQRKCAACASGESACPQCAAEEPAVQRQSLAPTITPLIQRQLNVCEEMEEEQNMSVAEEPAQEEQTMSVAEEEEPIQRQESSVAEEQALSEESSVQRSPDGNSYASSDITRRIESTKGQGGSLPENIQHELGSKMGADFSDIKIHTDGDAIQLNRELGAHAFTHGKDVYFNAGKYNTESADGQYLLAHELAHTMQQNNEIVQRLAITYETPLVRGACGGRFVRWIFALDNPAPAEGYIVQQVDEYNEELKCPSFGRCLARPTFTFWEAWFVNKGDTHEHLHSTLGFTDQSSFPGGPDKVGFRVHVGEVKFFPKSVTGDLGKDGIAPASPNGGWGPGAVPITGNLPSTKSPPSWWSNAPTEGPKTRQAYSAWRCCGTSDDFNVVKSRP